MRVMERWGFIWGGRFTAPDGNHFEYRRPPVEETRVKARREQ